jgi:hypothetical protein
MLYAQDKIDLKDARLNALKLEYLAHERDRSDHNGISIKKMEWCEGTFEHVLSLYELRRFFEASGVGMRIVHDKEEEEGHINGEAN